MRCSYVLWKGSDGQWRETSRCRTVDEAIGVAREVAASLGITVAAYHSRTDGSPPQRPPMRAEVLKRISEAKRRRKRQKEIANGNQT